jgi:hypothetical protein
LKNGGSFPGLASHSDASGNDYDSLNRFDIEIGNGAPFSPFTTRNNDGTGRPFDFRNNENDEARWFILVARWRTMMGRYYHHIMCLPGWVGFRDVGSAATNFTFTHTVLGARRNGGSIGNYGRSDWRHYSRYNTGHNDVQVAQMIKYLADKYKVPTL